VQVYRELVEWAILFVVLREKDFGTDTIIVCDGLLRSKVFAGDAFVRYLRGLKEGIENQFRCNRRRLFLAGVCKSSKVLDRYRLAMALEDVMATEYASYVEIPLPQIPREHSRARCSAERCTRTTDVRSVSPASASCG
jgi:hypothetical protein